MITRQGHGPIAGGRGSISGCGCLRIFNRPGTTMAEWVNLAEFALDPDMFNASNASATLTVELEVLCDPLMINQRLRSCTAKICHASKLADVQVPLIMFMSCACARYRLRVPPSL